MTIKPGQASRRSLTSDELAREAGTTAAYVGRLLASGVIQANPDGSHDIEDVPRVRLTLALADGGIDLDDLMEVIRSGALQLDWVAQLWTVTRPSGRSFADSTQVFSGRTPARHA